MDQQQALLETLQTDNPYSGSIKLACSGALAQWLYPKFIALQAQHQSLEVQFESAPNKRIFECVRQDHCLFGLVTQTPNQGEFSVKHIGVEILCLVLPKAYQNTPITSETLHKIGLVDHPDANQYLAKYIEECGNPELSEVSLKTLPHCTTINQLSQILYPITKGIGFTVLPLSAVVSSPFYSDLYVHIAHNNVEDSLYLICKKDRPLPSRYQQFITLIEQSVHQPKST
ncbi:MULTISPECIES: substrate-binding domain-containing protein [unclassified Vibrio]|uniref:substrate-binding domain-containing protein n=1 Tax=unclassified Vibrio TaxID=2614977 RepID=UPI00269C2C48|nr:substrate-binding domain-containing protein [Vibrio sp. UCD-FRSSP16_30]